MNTLWIIQQNLGQHSDITQYIDSIRRHGCLVHPCDIVPFSDDLPDIEYDGPTILYGSVNFVTRAHKSGKWFPGSFADPTIFTYTNWAMHYGEMLLNSPDVCQQTTIRDFVSTTRDPSENVFVRPEQDSKEINGEVQTVEQWVNFCKQACEGKFAGIGPDTKIVVGQAFGIEAEWRLFIGDGKIVTGSKYRQNGILKKERGYPDIVADCAKEAMLKWNPAPMYVLDICLSNNNPYIVEAQGFNSAGVYAGDIDVIVSQASQIAHKLWRNK